jgi:hypothetical protein
VPGAVRGAERLELRGCGKLLPRNSVGSAQVINGSLQKADLSKKAAGGLHGARGAPGAQGPAGTSGAAGSPGRDGANGAKGVTGAKGATGTRGATGAKGATGSTGAQGSPDTPAQVLTKLEQVDGAGSGLDADLLDGLGSSAFLRGSGAIVRRYRFLQPTGNFVPVIAQASPAGMWNVRVQEDHAFTNGCHVLIEAGASLSD